VSEVLRTGEEVSAEQWGCLICESQPEEALTPLPPEPAPPGSVSNPCPKCEKPYRLYVPASPHLEHEPVHDVLICGKCGHTELACPECRRSNIVVDAIGRYCLDCRRRLGEPEKAPTPQREPSPLPARRHTLGETPPAFPCPSCGHNKWREGIYSWTCRQCQHIAMKS
jgi:hypothetical protein